jgi:hypothetical protein
VFKGKPKRPLLNQNLEGYWFPTLGTKTGMTITGFRESTASAAMEPGPLSGTLKAYATTSISATTAQVTTATTAQVTTATTSNPISVGTDAARKSSAGPISVISNQFLI